MAETAPLELHDDLGCIIALRADRTTRGRARAFFAHETGNAFTKVRVRKAVYRYSQEYADEMAADGVPEPYDGWPLWECGPGENGTAYWQLVEDS